MTEGCHVAEAHTLVGSMLRRSTDLHLGPASGASWIPPVVDSLFDILTDACSDTLILQARHQLTQPSLVHPWREQGAQGGRTSRIGIHIASDVETACIRLIQQIEQG